MRDGPRRGRPPCPGFPSPYGAPAFASWASCSRQGIGPSSPPAYRRRLTAPRTLTGFSRSACASRDRGGRPLDPEASGVHTTDENSPAAACRSSTARPCTPVPIPSPELWVTRHQRGFTHVRPSGLPLACAPGWNGTRFGFSPELRTPRLPATHVRAGTGLEHWPGATSPTSSALQSTHSLATCSLVSHVLGPVIPHEQSHMFSCPRSRISPAACGRTISALMKQCSRPTPGGRARHPSSDQLSRPAGRGTISAQGFTVQAPRVLTCRRLPGPSLPDGRPVSSH